MPGITYVIHKVSRSGQLTLEFIGKTTVFEGDNRIYYDQRAAQATELGDRATDTKIAALHYELALRYAILSVQGSQAKPEVVAIGRQVRGTLELAGEASFGRAEPEFEQALRQA